MAEILAVVFGYLVMSVFACFASGQPYAATSWTDAYATFYGGTDNSGTMGGACGYGNLYSQGYGVETAALSNALFNNGLSCGACFQIVCRTEETNWCYPGASITVTATNNCPQGSYGGWCDYPKSHFDLSYAMFTTLAQADGGVVPVQYMRVACSKTGGIRFTIDGNPWYNHVLVLNVGGVGDVQAMSIRGDRTDFLPMDHSWGQLWTQGTTLVGQILTFEVTAGDSSYQKTWQFWNVADSNWDFGQTFESPYNFNF